MVPGLLEPVSELLGRLGEFTLLRAHLDRSKDGSLLTARDLVDLVVLRRAVEGADLLLDV